MALLAPWASAAFPSKAVSCSRGCKAPGSSAGTSLLPSMTPGPTSSAAWHGRHLVLSVGAMAWGPGLQERTLRCSGFSRGLPKGQSNTRKYGGSSRHPTGEEKEPEAKPLFPPPWGRLIPGATLGTSHRTGGQLCLLDPPRALRCPVPSLPVPLRLAFPGLPSSLRRCWHRALPLALLSSQEP